MRRGRCRVHRVAVMAGVLRVRERRGLFRRPRRSRSDARVVVAPAGVRPACGRTDLGLRSASGRRIRRRAGEILRRRGGEFRAASVAAEVVRDAVVDVRVPSGRGIDLHPAYRVSH